MSMKFRIGDVVALKAQLGFPAKELATVTAMHGGLRTCTITTMRKGTGEFCQVEVHEDSICKAKLGFCSIVVEASY